MKTIKNLLFLMFFFAACGDLTEIPDVEPSGKDDPAKEEEFRFSGDVTFSATIEDLADGTTQTWTQGDEILIYDGTKSQASKNAFEGQVGQYSMNVTDGATGFVAYYPYSEDVRIDGTTVYPSVPVDQTVEGNYSSRVAKSSSSVLFFNNLTGRLGFEVEMDRVK